MLVAQGWEAGGHRGVFDPAADDDQLGTMALTRLLVTQTGLPVIAAGGSWTAPVSVRRSHSGPSQRNSAQHSLHARRAAPTSPTVCDVRPRWPEPR
jgi:hypothetical protein